jgi:exodeoxyribonuclease VII large subunit
MRVLTVSQAVSYLRELMETDIVLGDVWISGEVSGPRTQPSGHTYFVLKDNGAQLRSVLFRSANLRQRRMTDYLAQGSQVIVHGRMTVYEARGELQVVVDFVQPEGVGLRHAQFEKLRLQLEEEGLFDLSRKRPMPRFPQRIGVATSSTGAVFHDICNVLRRRWPLVEVVLAPTPVQGPEAAPGIIASLEGLNARGDLDVIILARGGGSVEELWAFNEEPVARAVFASAVPVVSAVGHETDYTICDYVADLRAPTPSAAAELVAPDRQQLSGQIRGWRLSAASAVQRGLNRDRAAVTALLGRAQRGTVDLARLHQRLETLDRRGFIAVLAGMGVRRDQLQRCRAQLRALDPQATLDRGFAVVHKGGRVVSSVSMVSGGDGLVVKVADGGFTARVDAPALPRSRRARSNGSNNGAAPKPPEAVQPVLFP